MKTSKNLTVTEGRTREAFNNAVTSAFNSKLKSSVKTAVENERIRTGVITKYYPYLDKAEVKLDESKKVILCKILHRFGGDMIDFYTPLEIEESYDETLKEPCLIPRAKHNVCVLQIHDDDSDENLILGYYQNSDVVGFKPASPGNIKLMSITEPNLYWVEFGPDGLNLRLPKNPSIEVGTVKNEMENGDFYTKEEIDEKLKNLETEYEDISYQELLKYAEDYEQTSNDKYYLFRGDCWTINNNYESSAAITSESEKDLTVEGTFRTNQDLVGIYWNSKDPITHPYISYGSRIDYNNVIFECDVEYSGCLFDYASQSFNSTFTIEMNDNSIYYLKTSEYITTTNNVKHMKIDFNDLVIPAGSEYINKKGETVTVKDPFKLNVSNIKFIMFVLIPPTYAKNESTYTIRSNLDYHCKFSNIKVTNGDICNEHIKLDPHPYRICEGYDDFYNMNPMRICKEMRKLGYVEWCDLYIGASHFYEKSGTVGDTIDVSGEEFNHTRTEKMVLDTSVPLNKAFAAWLDCYSRELKKNDCPNLVVSVSMENLQCPQSWRQRDCNGNFAKTGWIPSTFFYSPCHPDVLPYMQSVSEACLDIVVANGMPPILQLGEAWWWWNEYDKPNQPPCFYDDRTKAKYKLKFGKDMPEYSTSWQGIFDEDMMNWLNEQIVNYSWGIREVVKADKYNDGLYTALFFPPSVIDEDRVPRMMQIVNYLTGIYSRSQLDFLQIEDYDWVTGSPVQPETKERDRAHHPKAYTIGEELGFTLEQQQYFGGFVQYPEDAIEFWREIKKAMDDALKKGFSQVFVWAGSQVRRDNKILGYDEYELVQRLLSDGKSTTIINMVDDTEQVDPDVPTGWQTFPRTSNFWNVTTDDELKYRKKGNLVEMSGRFQLVANEDHLTELLVGTLPQGFRPICDMYFNCQGTQSDDPEVVYDWVCGIRPTGEVYVLKLKQDGTWITPFVGNQFTIASSVVWFMV